ncbi:hypothetical protein B0H11DRAFT_2186135 [Mycena galericulata]|nr:hypothetical protein B0H11DRAFT_2186135 [Mycena galericulata]
MHTICVLRHRPKDFWEETAWRVQLPRKVHSQACQRVQLPKKVHSRREMMTPVKGKVLPLQILLLNRGNEFRTQAIALRVQALAQFITARSRLQLFSVGFAGTKIAFARGESPSSIVTIREALRGTASASVLEWFLNIVPVSLRSKTLEKGLMEDNATTQSSRGESPLGLMRKDGEIRLDTRRIRVLSMVRARGKKWGATPANFSSAHGSPQREADAVRSGDRTKPPPGPRAQRMPCSDVGSTVQEGTSAVVAPSRTQIFGSGEG